MDIKYHINCDFMSLSSAILMLDGLHHQAWYQVYSEPTNQDDWLFLTRKNDKGTCRVDFPSPFVNGMS